MKETNYYLIIIIGFILKRISIIANKFLVLLLLFPFIFKYINHKKEVN